MRGKHRENGRETETHRNSERERQNVYRKNFNSVLGKVSELRGEEHILSLSFLLGNVFFHSLLWTGN